MPLQPKARELFKFFSTKEYVGCVAVSQRDQVEMIRHKTVDGPELAVCRDLFEERNKCLYDSCFREQRFSSFDAQREPCPNSALVMVSRQTVMFGSQAFP